MMMTAMIQMMTAMNPRKMRAKMKQLTKMKSLHHQPNLLRVQPQDLEVQQRPLRQRFTLKWKSLLMMRMR
jgi:hypothetical protein